MRAKAHVEDMRGTRQAIVVSELPYAVNKASLIEKIADLVQNKKLAGISDIRDESDREGMRIVIEIKRDDSADRVLNNLFKHTAMQSAFNLNMLALVDQEPKTPLAQRGPPAPHRLPARRSSAAAPSTTSRRRRSARTSSRASRSRSTTSTRS